MFEGHCFSLSQESAYMFRFLKADREGRLRRITIRLLLPEGAITPLGIQGRDPSPPTEAACPRTRRHLLCRRLPRGERRTPSATATG